MSQCPALGCEKEVQPDKLMCLGHWFAVPIDQRRSVNIWWESVNVILSHKPVDKDRLRHAIRVYRRCREDAILSLRPKNAGHGTRPQKTGAP